VIGFRNDTFSNPGGLLAFIQKNNIVWRLRPDQKVLIKGEWDTPLERLAAAEKILRELANLAQGPAARPQLSPWTPPPPPPPPPPAPPPPPQRRVVKRPQPAARPWSRSRF
jgi:hypothetical protein